MTLIELLSRLKSHKRNKAERAPLDAPLLIQRLNESCRQWSTNGETEEGEGGEKTATKAVFGEIPLAGFVR